MSKHQKKQESLKPNDEQVSFIIKLSFTIYGDEDIRTNYTGSSLWIGDERIEITREVKYPNKKLSKKEIKEWNDNIPFTITFWVYGPIEYADITEFDQLPQTAKDIINKVIYVLDDDLKDRLGQEYGIKEIVSTEVMCGETLGVYMSNKIDYTHLGIFI